MREFNFYCGNLAKSDLDPKRGQFNLQLWSGKDDENVNLKIEDVHQPLQTDIPGVPGPSASSTVPLFPAGSFPA